MINKDIYSLLIDLRKTKALEKVSYYFLKLLGVELPLSVVIKGRCVLEHGAFGTVVHSKTVLGNNVRIYPNVTIGRADIHLPMEKSAFEGIVIEDDVILCPGSRILCKKGVLRVAKGSVIGANAVLFESTKEYEIWAGIPAKKIGDRIPL